MGRAADLEEERIIALILPTGALRQSELGLGSTGRRVLARLISSGTLQRTGPVVHLPEAAAPVLAARRCDGLLTCGSALAAYGLPELIPASPVHVAVPSSRGSVHAPGVTVHREPGLEVQGLAVPIDRLVARLLRCGPEKESIAIADNALHRGLVTREEVAARLQGNRHGCPTARRRLARCTDRARSPIESLARIELEDAGHRPVPGLVVPGVGELDLVMEGLDIETDGYTYHSLKSAWSNDRRRDQLLLARGVTPVRLTREDVMAGRTVLIVESVLRRMALSAGQGRLGAEQETTAGL